MWKFENFWFDPATNVLTGPRGQILLEPKPSALLAFFAENSGRDVSRDELLEKVWAGQIVSEGAINRVIVQLRKALGDESKIKRFIVTVPKVGYRFVAPAEKQSAPATMDRPRHRLLWLTSSVAALLTLAIVTLVFIGWGEQSPYGEKPVSVAPLIRLSGNQFDPAVSPDGLQLVFSQKTPSGAELYWMRGGSAPPQLIGEQGGTATSAAWAPDGMSLVYQFTANRACSFHLITFVSDTASAPKPLYECPADSSVVLAFSKDSSKLFFTEQPGEFDPAKLFELDLNSMSKRQVPQPLAKGRGNHYLDINPVTGNLLLLSDQSPGRTTAYSLNSDNGTFQRLFSWPFRVDHAIWGHRAGTLVHPGGHPSYQLVETDYLAGFSAILVSDSRRIKTPERIPNNHDYLFVSYLDNRDISIDGVSDQGLNSSVMDYLPTLSRNGQQIAFVSKRNGSSQVFVKDIVSGALRTIALEPKFLSIVALDWSFDDALILATTSQGLYIYDTQNGDEVRHLPTDLPAYGATWIAEHQIGFSQREAGAWRGYVFDLDTEHPVALAQDWAFALASETLSLRVNQRGELSLNGNKPTGIACAPFVLGRHVTFRVDESSLYCISATSPDTLVKFSPPNTIEMLQHTVSGIGQYSVAEGRRSHTFLSSSVSDIMRTIQEPD